MNTKSVKLIVRDGWVICPICGKGKILKIDPETTVHHLPRKCKRCGQETIVKLKRLSHLTTPEGMLKAQALFVLPGGDSPWP